MKKEKPIRYPWESDAEYILKCGFTEFLRMATKKTKKKKMKTSLRAKYTRTANKLFTS